MQELRQQPEPVWHRLTSTEILQAFNTHLDEGLANAEAQRRLRLYGPNVIAQRRGPGPLRRFLSQFSQALVVILIIAGAVTAALKEWVDAGVIFGVVIINAIVGYLQESKAVKAIEALARAMTAEATVIR
ncbi:MAG: cation-transporting P-type ATPase, partial [Thermoleophilia bacterium]|nr:cation-transporting P-type ATPase [Thermoleophilia bacterium]